MPLTEQTVIDRLEILRDGTIQVREAIEAVNDAGDVVHRKYHRRVVPITDENPDLGFADGVSRRVMQAARTQERVAAARARRESGT